MTEDTALRKHLDLDHLVAHRHQLENADYWRALCPQSSISDQPLQEVPPTGDQPDDTQPDEAQGTPPLDQGVIASHLEQLREERYFQTDPVLPAAIVNEMRTCIETVKSAGLPVMFALVYDVFYRAFTHYDTMLTAALGPDYRLIPNFWIYYVAPSDAAKGFEPHRDAEYVDTIGEDGLPTVLTLWVTITDATPLNSCMYVVPANRDTRYQAAIHDLSTGAEELALENIRAIPTVAGTLSCWDQYLYHWGSRGSRRAPEPRISYAMYCQRGDMAPVDDAAIDLRAGISFATRLGSICRGLYRYSYLSVQPSDQSQPLREFLEHHMAAL